MEPLTASALPRRLYKSRRNRIIDGVCGGIAEYFSVDPTIVRVLWVLVTLMGGTGFFLYIAAMIIMPVNYEELSSSAGSFTSTLPPPDKKRFWGILLVLVGAFLLLINLGWLADFGWWSFSGKIVFPILLIILGGVLIYVHTHRTDQTAATEGMPYIPGEGTTQQPVRELRRSLKDRKVFGVCGGIAKYFGIDSTIVRILYILLVLASFGWGLLLYIILGIVMRDEKPLTSSL